MKKILLVVLTAITVSAQAQYPSFSRGNRVSYSDPAVDNLQISGISNGAINVNRLDIGTPVKVSFKLNNNSEMNDVPAGSCELKITLGSKFKLAAGGINQVPNLPLSAYFNWSMTTLAANGQDIITGKLTQNLPPNFSRNIEFILLPVKEGKSTLTCQMMISNEDGASLLSDVSPLNNNVFISYTNVKPFGIKFVEVTAQPRGCSADIDWSVTDKDLQTARFFIETSTDGINFISTKTISATGEKSYNFLLENINTTSVSVRIKAESKEGSIKYSEPVLVKNLCNGLFEISLSPNPLPKSSTDITLTAKSGIFNGKYVVWLMDASGKDVNRTEVTYKNQVQVKYNTGNIAPGSYILVIANGNEKSAPLKFVKF
ncbi:MAG: hypothetical protein LH615_02000 [Ferruginibacter sp.]|nr:hypothetical protein [Ferruginibacter sp.]